MLFISPQIRPEPKKSSSFEMFTLIVAAIASLSGLVMMFVDTSELGGLLVLILRLFFPIGVIYLGIYFYRRYKRARSLLDKLR